jgi:hypothetical protein
MAYCSDNPSTEEVKSLYCDDCAEDGGLVPFGREDESGYRQQNAPWRWFPRYGRACDSCGVEC